MIVSGIEMINDSDDGIRPSDSDGPSHAEIQ